MGALSDFLRHGLFLLLLGGLAFSGCQPARTPPKAGRAAAEAVVSQSVPSEAKSPLFSDFYTADPSAHVFLDRLYIYPSHDIDAGIPADDLGNHFAMRDYHVLSLDRPGGTVRDHGVALSVDQVPWASRQMWAPDAAEKDDQYFLYFPAKDSSGVFRIGVAVSDRPEGPFEPQRQPIEGSFSIDPAVFEDLDGSYYMVFGGIWGGQLQRYQSGSYREQDDHQPPLGAPALTPKIARMRDDMLGFAEPVRDVVIVDERGKPLRSGDHRRRFFEAAWIHRYQGKYYLSYSTGNTHYIVYATGDSPYGPFTYQGRILEPVLGWTSHHSIVHFAGQWYLFYHDSQLSRGTTHLRNIKMTPLYHAEDGAISTIRP